MNIEKVIKALRAEGQRINAAITALVGTSNFVASSASTTRKLTAAAHVHQSKGRHMTPTAKRKMSISQKARWAGVKALNDANALSVLQAHHAITGAAAAFPDHGTA